MVERKLTAKYALFQGIYWMLAAVALAYMTPILEAKGFSSMEIGILNFIKYTSVIVFQTWLGSFSDKYAKVIPLKWIIGVLAVAGLGATFVFWHFQIGMAGTVIVMIILGASVNCVSPLIDSLSIQYMNHGRKMNYTISRAAGSFTYAVSCIFAGFAADCFGTEKLLILQMIAISLLILWNGMMDRVNWEAGNESDEKKCKEESKVHSVGYLFTHFPKYVLFLIACMLIFMGYNLNATFLIDVIEKLGGSNFDYGMAQFVVSFSEIPVALLFYRIIKHISIDRLMLCCSVFCTLRAAMTTFAESVPVLVVSQALELFGLAIFYAGSVFFVMENLPAADEVKGVSLINVFTVGIGEAAASLLCGVIRTHLGLHALMLVSIYVSVAGVCVMALMTRAKGITEKKIKCS